MLLSALELIHQYAPPAYTILRSIPLFFSVVVILEDRIFGGFTNDTALFASILSENKFWDRHSFLVGQFSWIRPHASSP